MLVFVMGFLAFLAWNNYVRAPKAKAVEPLLVAGFRLVKRLPQSIPIGYQIFSRGGSASADETYKTKLTYQEIRSHYDRELTRNGWVFQKEKKLLDWGKDYGGMTLTYCKGPYQARLDYSGHHSNYEPYFDLSMSWGDESLVELITGKYCK